MTIRYCPSCRKNVQVVREDLDVGLAIFLFCCTSGIGLIIYLFIYFIQPEDRCIFCQTKTNMALNPSSTKNSYPVQYSHLRAEPKKYNVQKKNSNKTGTYKRKILEPPLQETYDPFPDIDETTGKLSVESRRFCSLCGQEHSHGQKFCSSCGAELRD